MSKSQKHVAVRLERKYSRGRLTYDRGDVITVPASAVKHIEGANPPYGHRISEKEEEQLSGTAAPNATDGAIEYAEEIGFDMTPHAGKGTGAGGRITKADVEGWQTD